MNSSEYLRSRMEMERQIALSLDQGFALFQQNGKKVLSNIYSGAERASWYTSCFFDDYQDICQELKEEDKRMIAAIKEIYNRKDIIFDMIEMYVNYILENFSESQRKSIAAQITGFLANNRTKFVTKSGVSYLVAKSISESMNFTPKMRAAIGKTSNIILTLLDFYSYVQKAALSARQLKSINPGFYYTLYTNNVEMLYFIIDPVLYKNIDRKNNVINERSAVDILREITK